MEKPDIFYTLTFPVLVKAPVDFTAAIDDNCKQRINISNAAPVTLLVFVDFNDGNVSSTQNPCTITFRRKQSCEFNVRNPCE
jgi:hypothetical protein